MKPQISNHSTTWRLKNLQNPRDKIFRIWNNNPSSICTTRVFLIEVYAKKMRPLTCHKAAYGMSQNIHFTFHYFERILTRWTKRSFDSNSLAFLRQSAREQKGIEQALPTASTELLICLRRKHFSYRQNKHPAHKKRKLASGAFGRFFKNSLSNLFLSLVEIMHHKTTPANHWSPVTRGDRS